MPFIDKIVDWFLAFTERSRITRTIVCGVIAFVVIFGIDLLWRLGGLSLYSGQLLSDVVEATLLALIASYLSRRREERILRRQREIGYLNHHVRNSLTLIQMAEAQLNDTDQRIATIECACRKILQVIEQLSRAENVSIDNVTPVKICKDRNAA